MTTLVRASIDLHAEGRTLEGIAFQFDRASKVKDPGKPPYLEAFARGSADNTIKHRSTFPVFAMHDYSRLPLGAVTFEPSSEIGALMFRAPLSKTRDGDEALELVNDGALRSVSVGFRDIRSGTRMSPEGTVTVRQEIALRELSLAPTGFAQHQGAEVLAVRTEPDETPLLDALRRRRSLLVIP